MNRTYRPLQHMLRKMIASCCCHGFLFGVTLMLLLCAHISHASLEPANKHLDTSSLSKDTATTKQAIDIANPKLSLSTRMSSITLPVEPAANLPEDRDELLIAARAQPSQNHSDLGAAGAQDSPTGVAAEVKAEESKVEKIYKEENNYLLALALILLTAGTIAFVLFFKW